MADNASVNGKMAHKLELQIPHLNSATQILACVAHAINLSEKVSISALGTISDHLNGDKVSMATNYTKVNGPGWMNISSLVSTPDAFDINAKMINKQLHGLCIWGCFSPQQNQIFLKAIYSCKPDLYAKEIKFLEINLATR
ncbi:hypothetical protein VP01_910g6 [Puccinia sorghi]|uniref:Uncharacterized protein n=1 Tax=Puccinia sorghi TaxID=27349 RepID=A0A0L6U867_9BASI|nr:hypothetical protein VP01_910g6 [Puccinia sorghi]